MYVMLELLYPQKRQNKFETNQEFINSHPLNIDTIILHAGTWTSENGGNLPTCAQVNCDSAVTTITNGLITSFGSYLVGGQLTYQCNAGMYTYQGVYIYEIIIYVLLWASSSH